MRGLATVLSLSLVASASAQLTWDSRSAEKTAQPTDLKVTIEFPFTNTGQSSIHIVHVRASCGCTEAHADNDTYLPGEHGVIQATLDLAGRKGKQRKTIRVVSDDPAEPVTQLEFTVEIPEMVSVTPNALSWPPGDRSPRSVHLRIPDGVSLSVREAKADSDAFAATLKEAADGHVVITVQPSESAGTTEHASLHISTDAEGTAAETIAVPLSIGAPARVHAASRRTSAIRGTVRSTPPTIRRGSSPSTQPDSESKSPPAHRLQSQPRQPRPTRLRPRFPGPDR